MNAQVDTKRREANLVEDAAQIRVMGFSVLEALPFRSVPYEQVDPFILLHEARLRLSDLPSSSCWVPEMSSRSRTLPPPGTRFMLMAAQLYGETVLFNGPFVD